MNGGLKLLWIPFLSVSHKSFFYHPEFDDIGDETDSFKRERAIDTQLTDVILLSLDVIHYNVFDV